MSKNNGSITPDTVFITTSPNFDPTFLINKLEQYLQDTKSDRENQIVQAAEAVKRYEAVEKIFKDLPKKDYIVKAKLENKLKENLEKLKTSKAKLEIFKGNSPPTLDKCCFLKIYQHKHNDGEFSVDKPMVRHYGVDSITAKSLIGTILTLELHPIEEQLFKEAIKYLREQCDSETFLSFDRSNKKYINNIALVDIFPRNPSYIHVDDKKLNEAETHTVVLWRTKENEITLIDPSNESFSRFLISKTIENHKIVAGLDGGCQIYSAKVNGNLANTGPQDYKAHPMIPRDCTDIAVKLAFDLNEHQLTSADIETIKKLAIEQISNQEIAKNYKELNSRALQSSDYKVRIDAKETLDKFKALPKLNDQTQIIDFKKIHNMEEMKEVMSILGELHEAQPDLFI